MTNTETMRVLQDVSGREWMGRCWNKKMKADDIANEWVFNLEDYEIMVYSN